MPQFCITSQQELMGLLAPEASDPITAYNVI